MPDTNRRKALRLLKLKQHGGSDAELTVLAEIMHLEDDFRASVAEVRQEFKDRVKEIVDNVPDLNKAFMAFKGAKGDSPTDEHLKELIKPLIPPPIKGDAYVLTDADKRQIAKEIPVPVVERIVETVVKEQPIVTNEIKEVAIPETAEDIRNKLELLQGDDRLDAAYIRGLDELDARFKRLEGRVQTPAKSYQIHTADCSSQCDGNTKTFTVGGSHFGIVGVFSTEFPNTLRPVLDYTITATGFALTAAVSAPVSGQTLIALFLK